jgi:hypothetical protein
VNEQTPAAEFVAVVDRLRREVSSTVHAARESDADYLLADVRLDEAARVAPCVSRFAAAEILPDDPRPAIGRYASGALGLSPSLGHLLRKRLLGASEEAQASLRNVVVEAVSFGYIAAVDAKGAHITAGGDPTELAVRLDRTAEQIWSYWVVSFAGDAGQAFDTRFRRTVQDLCSQRIIDGLRQLALLPPIGRRTKLKATAGTYASAGLLLRMRAPARSAPVTISATARQAPHGGEETVLFRSRRSSRLRPRVPDQSDDDDERTDDQHGPRTMYGVRMIRPLRRGGERFGSRLVDLDQTTTLVQPVNAREAARSASWPCRRNARVGAHVRA